MNEPLPFDMARCSGRHTFDDGDECPERETCQRFLTFRDWDKGKVPHYRGISVIMAPRECTIKIEVIND